MKDKEWPLERISMLKSPWSSLRHDELGIVLATLADEIMTLKASSNCSPKAGEAK